MSLYTLLEITCACGAKLDYRSTYAPYVHKEREAFDKAHAVCRERAVTGKKSAR